MEEVAGYIHSDDSHLLAATYLLNLNLNTDLDTYLYLPSTR